MGPAARGDRRRGRTAIPRKRSQRPYRRPCLTIYEHGPKGGRRNAPNC
jgi:hypothetical protein